MGDFGSATEAMRIIDLFALQIFAKKSGRCNFRLLQHYRPTAEVRSDVIIERTIRFHAYTQWSGLPKLSEVDPIEPRP
jgi:hypothetical protein